MGSLEPGARGYVVGEIREGVCLRTVPATVAAVACEHLRRPVPPPQDNAGTLADVLIVGDRFTLPDRGQCQ